MIYRMHPDVKQFQLFQLDADTVEETMGEECLIYMDATPTHYVDSWKSIEIEFYDAITESPDTTKKRPDIMADDDGKLFLSQAAYHRLQSVIDSCGEALPVTYADQAGYLFNVLMLAEQHNAVDQENTQRDHNGLVRLALNETALSRVALFRTEEDDYLGIYCGEEVKDLIETHTLQGCILTPDLSDSPG